MAVAAILYGKAPCCRAFAHISSSNSSVPLEALATGLLTKYYAA